MKSIIAPKRPRSKGWSPLPPLPATIFGGYNADVWYHEESGLRVISAVEVAEADIGPEYHISISKVIQFSPSGISQKRCSSNEAKWVLKEFDLSEAEEDNHVPHGFVRNFWRPVADKFVGLECPCKKTEAVIKEDKGDFIWRT